MSEFAKRWDKQQDDRPFSERIRQAIKPEGPLKLKIEQAIKLLRLQVTRLDNTLAKLRDKDSKYFSKVVYYLQRHDNERANIYATELAEIRKIYKMISQAKLALEEIETRLSTATEIGDVVAVLGPAMGVINGIKSGMSGVMPSAENEITEISSLLNNILVDAGTFYGSSINFEATSDEAEKILSEASAVAEAKMKQTLPDVTGLGLSEQSKE